MLNRIPSLRSTCDRTQHPIGVFDSGVGGLTVWRELRRQLPQESIVYFGDTARVPYGDRSPQEILQFGREILRWMVDLPVKLIVVACNTSSALALDQLRQECPVPILGLILPGAREAFHRGQRIGVIATPATVRSQAYRQALFEIGMEAGRSVLCWEQACPEFVPLIEKGHYQDPYLYQIAQDYLQPLLDQNIDTLVYGCTHYPLLNPLLRPLLPATVQIVDPAIALVEAVVQELDLWGLRQSEGLPHPSPWQNTQFFVSGDPQAFAQAARQWLRQDLDSRRLSENLCFRSVAEQSVAEWGLNRGI